MKLPLCTATLLTLFLPPLSTFAAIQEEAHQLCQTDINQPPGDIRSTSEVHVSPLEVQYIDSPSELVNNGQPLQASMKSFAAILSVWMTSYIRWKSSIFMFRLKTRLMANATPWSYT